MKYILLILLLPCLTGCAYLHDRVRDTSDMVTLSAEATGLNASLQIGPSVIGAGLSAGKGVGLRSGGLGMYEFEEINLVLFGSKVFVPRECDIGRDKGYEFYYTWYPWRDEDEGEMNIEEGKWFNKCQIECAVNAGIGARAGINLAEILDFIFGWTTLDICGDDLATIEKREQEECRKNKKSDNKMNGQYSK